MPPKTELVYVKADRSLCLEPRKVVERQTGRPLVREKIDRAPWRSAKVIEIPASASKSSQLSVTSEDHAKDDNKALAWLNYDNAYQCRLVYDRVAKHMTWRRLTGTVKHYSVFEYPLT